MIQIDGSEGGGQILRSSLTLSLVTGEPFHMRHIRGLRPKPGLKRQHLSCVEAALALGEGSADGALLGSEEMVFHPGSVRGGDYHVRISTAGSTMLVWQTLVLALLGAGEPSTVVIEGGTHNPMAPPFPFMEEVYLPVLARMGAKVQLALDRHGFAPAGGGQITAKIEPSTLVPVELLERGVREAHGARILVAHLDAEIAQREQRVLEKQLGWSPEDIRLEEISESAGPGNVIHVSGRWAQASELVTAHGVPGRSAEAVARSAAKAFVRYENAAAPVGRHLADQVLLPMALAGGGRFRTLPLGDHFKTNRRVIEAFLPMAIQTTAESRSSVLVDVRPL